MAIRVTLECGHASQLRARTTLEGYTHDWEVFVRGVDNADIHHYVEKVVFYLHETFPKPKRVLKEPPFVVKESGYAGFMIPIHVYLKNKDEPKKFMILYDLSLQQSGPAINKVIHHNEIINNPSDEFRKRLLRGGAVMVSNMEDLQDKGETKTPPMVGKPKLSGSETKKHRPVEPKTSNSFADLFGPPIKTAKISPDGKKVVQPDRNSTPKVTIASEKSDKTDKPVKAKESPHKDGKREKMEERKDRKSKDHTKEKTKNKEKSKRSSSPGAKGGHSSPMSKRSSSPIVLKKPSSPSASLSTKRSNSPKVKDRDSKKSLSEKEKEKEKEREREREREREKEKEKEKEKEREKEREKEKTRESNKVVVIDTSKVEKKKDKKKHKEEREKERREKNRDGERTNVKDAAAAKVNDKKIEKTEKLEKPEKEKNQEHKLTSKEGKKSPKATKEWDSKGKEEKSQKYEKLEKQEKSKDGKNEKDRQRHKHKKRDKKEKRDGSKDREKREKRDKTRMMAEKHSVDTAPHLVSSTPLSTLLSELPERDTSDSAPSVDEDAFLESTESTNVIKTELDSESCAEAKLVTRKDFEATMVVATSVDAASSTMTTTLTATKAAAFTSIIPSGTGTTATAMPSITTTMTTTTTTTMTTATTATTTTTTTTTTTMTMTTSSSSSPTLLIDVRKEKIDRNKKDKGRTNRSEDRENRKRKRKSDGKVEEEQNIIPTKREREKEREREKDGNRGNSTPPLVEPVSSSQSPIGATTTTTTGTVIDTEFVRQAKEKSDRIHDRTERSSEQSVEVDAEQVAPDSTNSTLVEAEAIAADPSVFSEDYVSQLKDLQQKIMTLQDNQELERVVQVIVETGQYEITNKSFDFDLCALDRRTVQRLQQFFSAT